jgi:hypothetical protein
MLVEKMPGSQGSKREIDITNKRFSKLIVAGKDGTRKRNRPVWLCVCDCGNTTRLLASALLSGNTKSCGCWKIAAPIERSEGRKKSPLYSVWYGMKQRCHYPKAIKYRHYGARGITVCPEWKENSLAFIRWGEANGYAPGLDLDRINNDMGYSPENCRFITHKRNCQNRSKKHGIR